MNGQTTVRELLEYWLEIVMRDELRKTSYAAYRGYVRNHIVPDVGEYRLTEIMPETVQTLTKTLKAKSLASKTVRSIMVVLRSALDVAADYGYIQSNPCRKVKLPKIVGVEVKTFGLDEQRRIERVALESDDNRCIGVLIGFYAGLRIGEICALRFSDIDFENSRLTVGKSMKRVLNYADGEMKTSVVEEEPKTAKSKRTIPIPKRLCALIQKRLAESNGEYVISMRSGKRVEPRTFQFVYERLLKAASVPYCKFHTCRHQFVSNAIALGGDIKSISEMCGHSGIGITLSVYAHSMPGQKEKLMEKMNEMFLETAASATVFS
ncbi:MAG: site-specific integrase [Clostridiales bacterium]|jgi:integrase|nr:site-specific integrase [Clostridiales bacterium]